MSRPRVTALQPAVRVLFDEPTHRAAVLPPLTGNHYHSRPDGTAMTVAEADTATGHIDGPFLDAIADAASYLPVT